MLILNIKRGKICLYFNIYEHDFHTQLSWAWHKCITTGPRGLVSSLEDFVKQFVMLINVKMPTIVGILTFISMFNTAYIYRWSN